MERRTQPRFAIDRYVIARVILLAFGLLFIGRLFQVQVIRHDYYQLKANSTHNKSYELPAERGEIFVLDKTREPLPLALNETYHRVIADPRFISDPHEAATQLAELTGGDREAYVTALEKDSAYSVVESFVPLSTGEEIAALKLKGIALREVTKRVYPETSLAAHVLGFVNADGAGQYGVEQQLNETLNGTPGRLTGAFDVRGIPIAVAESIEQPAEAGEDVVLTLDRNVQYAAESALKEGVERVKGTRGSVVVMDPRSGAIKALANYPTFEPGNYRATEDISVFTNAAISDPIEPGSVVKMFSMAAGLETQVVRPETTYLDRSCERIDGFNICNVGDRVTKQRSMTETITRSANTGAIHVLKALDGDTSQISLNDKQILYDFYTQKLRLGAPTNVELVGERGGLVDSPNASDARYANMTFGQGLSINMVQLGASLSALINDGTYYQPYIVDRTISSEGVVTQHEPAALGSGVVSAQTSEQLKAMMETVVTNGGGRVAFKPGYRIGGKTGSAQIANPAGGYYEDKVLGTFFGFAPFDRPEYVIVVRIDEPQGNVFAGSGAAAPVFASISEWLIDYYGIAPDKVE